MTTLARLAIAALLSLFASSCMMDMNFGNGKTGNGEIVEESRDVKEDFDIVSASEGIDVFVTQGSDFNISVEADENIIDLIGTDIKDGRLKIHAIENIGRATKNVYVTLPKVTALESSSGADLHVEVVAGEVSADASSGADIKVSGQADVLYADASSGSDIKAQDLIVKRCNADASSGADISVNVSESLVADASSGADIRYTGEASVETKKSVSGSVRKY